MREHFARIGYDFVVVATATWVLFSGAGFPSIVAFVLLNLGALRFSEAGSAGGTCVIAALGMRQ